MAYENVIGGGPTEQTDDTESDREAEAKLPGPRMNDGEVEQKETKGTKAQYGLFQSAPIDTNEEKLEGRKVWLPDGCLIWRAG